jgi:hypothetical protein
MLLGMTDQDRTGPGHGTTERPIVPTDIDPADSGRGVDDHLITPHPRGIGHQPTNDLDEGVAPEHLSESSQGVKIEDAPDPQRDRPPEGESEAD